MTAPLVLSFLDAASELPSIAPRTLFHDSTRTRYFTAAEAAALPDSTRAKLVKRTLDESFYYNTRYGTPLAYSRPLEILYEAGLKDLDGKRVLDFGYGTIGHLRLLATLGASMTGVEVDPLLDKLYRERGDTGTIRGRSGRVGSIQLVNGHFPSDPAVRSAVGDGYDLFVSKNTLKNGYVHPAFPVDPRRLVHLEVDDSTFVREVFRILRPGGLAMIYNLCPAQNPPDKPYIPWADGRCPFPESMWRAAGFRVLAFDRDDNAAARRMGHALEWDRGESPMNLENDLFGAYTLVEKPKRQDLEPTK
jgi:SAM-dependent methyltransferase